VTFPPIATATANSVKGRRPKPGRI